MHDGYYSIFKKMTIVLVHFFSASYRKKKDVFYTPFFCPFFSKDGLLRGGLISSP